MFKCYGCDKDFSQKFNLTRHLLICQSNISIKINDLLINKDKQLVKSITINNELINKNNELINKNKELIININQLINPITEEIIHDNKLYTSKNECILVSLEDYSTLNQYKWNIGKDGYVKTNIKHKDTKQIKCWRLHRYIMIVLCGNDLTTDNIVDHIDSNPLNNARSNLRIVNYIQNSANRCCSKNSKTQLIGVSKSGNKWVAKITFNGLPIKIGTFDNMLEAAEARDLKAFELNGEYAKLNFPLL